MDFSFSEEQIHVRNNIIDFAKKELNKNIAERYRDQKFPMGLWQKCADQMLTGLPVDPEFGGGGLSPLSTMVALEALGYASEDGGLNFSICAHLLAGVVPIWKYGNEFQKRKYLAALCNGSKIVVNAMTESESGSDVFNIKTTAVKKDKGFVINGAKTFCSNGNIGDRIIVYAATDSAKGYFGGITAFIVEKESEGFNVGQQFEKMGLCSSGICELLFENVFVPEENILGGIGGGATVFNYSMEWERIGMAACHVGTMKRLLQTSIEYAQTRKSGSEPIGKKQAIAHRIANMKVQTEASALLTYKAAFALNKSKENMSSASEAKLFVSEAYVNVALDCMEIFGGNGYMTEFGVERIVRDALGSRIYSGTSDIQKNIISRLLGL